ncbi:MAG: SUMF1/EgtB/PvdO family nonheme iron enzyme [Planctomycetota bacterium]|nr:SUMF1/EgtB/PvdO family nonheme iron enzyme [Planctomycetota bacterium]
MRSYITILAAVLFVSCCGLPCFAACPSVDLTGDCRVDFADINALSAKWLNDCNVSNDWCDGVDITRNGTVNLSDFAVVAEQWLTEGIPDPDGMVWVSINDPGIGGGHEGFTGYMSKYETTNAQYCQFLNAALASGDITRSGNTVYGANGSNSGTDFLGQVYYNLAGSGYNGYGATNGNGGAARIHYSGGSFTVDTGFENHPVTYVSWYGATAFCNYYGYRLPTEWEWQAVADYNGSYTYGCGTIINNSMANYYGSTHPDGTTVVGAFGTYGYGMCDMAGNAWEWTSSFWDPVYSDLDRIIRGGCWPHSYGYCTVSYWNYDHPNDMDYRIGFRVCR